MTDSPEFKPMTDRVGATLNAGTKVYLVGDPTVVGIVAQELVGGDDPKFEVFCGDGKTRTLYASQLARVDATVQSKTISVDRMKAALTATQLARPSASHLYSLSSSRVDFVPYQFRPVMKLINSDRPRLLIADEVGVGKTIEAGLILKELQARREIESVLIICPKPLVTENKWREEMKRFDETFEHLDGAALRYCIEETRMEGKWPARYSRAIIPYSLLDETLLLGNSNGKRRIKGLLDLDEPPKFDLIIVDEAHHIRNTDTWSHRNVSFLVDNAEAVVFLTATPIQTRERDLFNLLRLLRPDVITEPSDFERIGAPNPGLNLAATAARRANKEWSAEVREHLADALSSPWGRDVVAHDPRAHEVLDLLNTLDVIEPLNSAKPLAEESASAETRVRVIRLLEELHTFSGFITRTRRRDIGNFTVRKPRTSRVEFTEAQRNVHDELIQLCSAVVEARHGSGPVQFLVSGLRRQVASSVNGLAQVLQDLLDRRMTTFEDFVDDDEDPAEIDLGVFKGFEAAIVEIIRNASKLGDNDPKYESMEQAIRDRLEMPNPKVLLFTSYRHTITYLHRRLVQSGIRVAQVNGDLPDSDRREMRRRFTLPTDNPDAYDVLLSTEVGTEGLDYQFCDTLINYDLPWNPMKIEQRIGRIDRRGQKSETVAIINLITDGTIDAQIYDRCLSRIGVFEQALGASEAILGDITTEIRRIADDFRLTPEEQGKRLQQLADNEIHLVEEQLKLEEEREDLFGLEMPTGDDDVVRNATSRWLTPTAVAHLVVEYLLDVDDGRRLNLSAGRIATLRLSRASKDRVLSHLAGMSSTIPLDRHWKSWLRGDEQTIQLTVDTGLAGERPDVQLLSPTHPLVRTAASQMQLKSPVTVNVRITGTDVPPGRYNLAVHGWNRLGLRADYQLRAVATGSVRHDALMEAVIGPRCVDSSAQLSEKDLAALETIHYTEWELARLVHQKRSRARAEARLRSLLGSSTANIGQLEEQLEKASDSGIQRMRTSQISSARNDYERRRAALESGANQSDIETELLVVATIEVY